jgi:hypothetical protein
LVALTTTAFGLTRELHVGLLQVFLGWPDLVFNIDHRYLLMHAWSIVQAGGASETLAMAGTAIRYHSGPAWFAASAASVLGGDPSSFLFLWFPFAAVVTIALSVHRILRHLGSSFVGAVVGLAFALAPPWAHIRFGGGTRAALWDVLSRDFASAGDWFVRLVINPTSEMMLNSLLGLAIIVAAIALHLANHTTSSLAVSATMIALSAAAKPQYAIAGSLLLLAVGLATLDRGRIPRILLVILPVAAAVLSLALGWALFGASVGSYPAIPGSRSLSPLDWRAVRPFLPSQPHFVFGTVGLLMLLISRHGATRIELRAVRFGGLLALGMLGFWLLLTLLSQGGDLQVREWAWNSMQALAPVSRMLTAAVAAALYALAARVSHRLLGIPLVLIALSGTSAGVQAFSDLTDPLSGHEVVDASEIRVLLQRVDPEEALILVSDLSDPAQNHLRDGSAFYLSNLYGHRFWLTQTRYGHQLLPETARRRAAGEEFFATDWSPWHQEFLIEEQISHVAVSARCPSAWVPDDIDLLVLIEATESWTIFRVGVPTGVSVPPRAVDGRAGLGIRPSHDPTAPTAMPDFGIAPCR